MQKARLLCVLAALGLVLAGCQQAFLPGSAPGARSLGQGSAGGEGGFDEFGYNYNARIFVGAADGVDKVLDGTVWGDPFYASDHLVMKWSKAWNDARFHDAAWTPDAWEDNEWNGMGPDGSGEVWHYKIVWVGPELENSLYWREGGYAIWGQFEVIFSHGTAGGEHTWETHALPSGYGPN
jgi:hypothetical protein